MVTINSSSLRSNVFETLYDVLSSTLPSTVLVTAAYVTDEPLFPQVVIGQADVVKENPSFSRSFWRNSITINIDLYTKKAKEIDTISDAIDNALSGRLVAGLTLSGWVESRAYPVVNEQKVHYKTISLTYIR